jgi:hypothetical protein
LSIEFVQTYFCFTKKPVVVIDGSLEHWGERYANYNAQYGKDCGGIYLWIHKPSMKAYIGSGKGLFGRAFTHWNRGRKTPAKDGSERIYRVNTHLVNRMQKYGVESFCVVFLEVYDLKSLGDDRSSFLFCLENQYLDYLFFTQPRARLYNTSARANGGA